MGCSIDVFGDTGTQLQVCVVASELSVVMMLPLNHCVACAHPELCIAAAGCVTHVHTYVHVVLKKHLVIKFI